MDVLLDITDQYFLMNATLVMKAALYVLQELDVKIVFSDSIYGLITLVMLLAQLDGLKLMEYVRNV
jgi:hypothetical protein